MKTSPLKTRRESIWSNRPEHQDLQESRSGRPWAGRQASCRSKKAWKQSVLNNVLVV